MHTWSKLKERGWFHSPNLETWQKKILADMKARVPKAPGVLWVLSSGTQSVRSVKAIALTEEGILASSASVNKHLESTRSDRWLVAIPEYHVGGLSIYARAHLSGASIAEFSGKWSARAFHQALIDEKITLCSLVPTQIHDLVAAGLTAPAGLRAIVVGGGALQPWLYSQARSMGWPLLPSYGLTECASQVATASLTTLRSSKFPALEILSHVQVRLENHRVFVKSPSLCRWIARGKEGEFTLEDPLRDGWFGTEDLAELDAGDLRIVDRRDSVVKILGVLVPVQEVEFELGEFLRDREWSEVFTIVPVPDARAGSSLLLVTDSPRKLEEWCALLKIFNQSVPRVRRVSGPCWVTKIPRSDLGKVKRAQLTALVNSGTDL